MPTVLSRGVDYSFSRPDIDCLWRAGYRFAVRYATGLSSRKQADRAELAALIARGFHVVVTYQDGTSDMLRGRDEGVKDAWAAAADARDFGMPADRPVYFTLDRDPNSLTASQMNAVKSYLDGAASVLGRQRVGIYAGFRGIEELVPRWAPWGWQTFAWSGGRISDKAHFRQYRNGVSTCGGQVDLNESYKPDFGQWPITAAQPEEDDMKAIELIAHDRAVTLIVGGGTIPFDSNERRTAVRKVFSSLDIEQVTTDPGTRDWIVRRLNEVPDVVKVLAAVKGLDLDVTLDPADITAIVDAIKASGVPSADAIAQAIGEKLTA